MRSREEHNAQNLHPDFRFDGFTTTLSALLHRPNQFKKIVSGMKAKVCRSSRNAIITKNHSDA